MGETVDVGAGRSTHRDGCEFKIVRVDLNFYRFRNGGCGTVALGGQIVLLTELIEGNFFGLRGSDDCFRLGLGRWLFNHRFRFGRCWFWAQVFAQPVLGFWVEWGVPVAQEEVMRMPVQTHEPLLVPSRNWG